MLVSVSQVTGPLTIGEKYLVPCIGVVSNPWAEGQQKTLWLPIFGPPHTDIEIGIDWKHYHYDTRFITAKMLRDWFQVNPENEERFPLYFAARVMAQVRKVESRNQDDSLYYHPDMDRIEEQPLICVRQPLTFPGQWPKSGWLWDAIGHGTAHPDRWEAAARDPDRSGLNTVVTKVQETCQGRTFDPENPVCPHKGFPLKQLPIDDEGCVICPGHGLRLHRATGQIMPRCPVAPAAPATNEGGAA